METTSTAETRAQDPRYKPLRVCRRCGTMAKPRFATRAIALGSLWLTVVALDVLMRVINPLYGTAHPNEEHPVLWAMFAIAVLHPRVCRRCQSLALVPVDTPIGRVSLED